MSSLSSLADPSPGTRHWPHAPPHILKESGVYFVTARTLRGVELFDTPERRDWFQKQLFALSAKYDWRLEAWAVLSNHYHLMAHSPAEEDGGPATLSRFLRHLHGSATRQSNQWRGAVGVSRLWHNFRETRMEDHDAYMARLHYVHSNAVHHRLVPSASLWKWCSATQFEEAVSPAWRKTVYSFKFDIIAALDGE